MKSTYMVLLRGSWKDWNAFSPEESQQWISRYSAWAQKLREEGRLKGGNALKEKTTQLKNSRNGVQVTDGPYAETKEAITGYFLIEAESHAAAVEIARGCPALEHGESVEVAEVGH